MNTIISETIGKYLEVSTLNRLLSLQVPFCQELQRCAALKIASQDKLPVIPRPLLYKLFSGTFNGNLQAFCRFIKSIYVYIKTSRSHNRNIDIKYQTKYCEVIGDPSNIVVNIYYYSSKCFWLVLEHRRQCVDFDVIHYGLESPDVQSWLCNGSWTSPYQLYICNGKPISVYCKSQVGARVHYLYDILEKPPRVCQ